jgi:hypothetical protein
VAANDLGTVRPVTTDSRRERRDEGDECEECGGKLHFDR